MAIVRLNIDKNGNGCFWVDGENIIDKIDNFKIIGVKDGKSLKIEIKIDDNVIEQKERINLDIDVKAKGKTKRKK